MRNWIQEEVAPAFVRVPVLSWIMKWWAISVCVPWLVSLPWQHSDVVGNTGKRVVFGCEGSELYSFCLANSNGFPNVSSETMQAIFETSFKTKNLFYFFIAKM